MSVFIVDFSTQAWLVDVIFTNAGLLIMKLFYSLIVLRLFFDNWPVYMSDHIYIAVFLWVIRRQSVTSVLTFAMEYKP